MKRVAVVVGLSLLLSPASAAQEQTAVVGGAITDFLTGAAVPRAAVIFETSAGRYRTYSAKDGRYIGVLPVGIYRITVSRMTYCSGRRGPTHIKTFPNTNLDFVLAPCPTVEVGITVNGRYAGEEAREVNPFSYDTFKLPSPAGTVDELLVRFGSKQEMPPVIDYQGTKVKHAVRNRQSKLIEDHFAYVGVMLSYDLLTVSADNVKLETESFEVEAHGNVMVEDGNSRTKANAVRIKLRGDKPLITVIRY